MSIHDDEYDPTDVIIPINVENVPLLSGYEIEHLVLQQVKFALLFEPSVIHPFPHWVEQKFTTEEWPHTWVCKMLNAGHRAVMIPVLVLNE